MGRNDPQNSKKFIRGIMHAIGYEKFNKLYGAIEPSLWEASRKEGEWS